MGDKQWSDMDLSRLRTNTNDVKNLTSLSYMVFSDDYQSCR